MLIWGRGAGDGDVRFRALRRRCDPTPTHKTQPNTTKHKKQSYTGYTRGLRDTFGLTPAYAQLEARSPPPGSFLATRESAPLVATPHRDPCNHPGQLGKRFDRGTLWPSQQAKARQDSSKPPSSQLALGDGRIDPFVTSYSTGDV